MLPVTHGVPFTVRPHPRLQPAAAGRQRCVPVLIGMSGWLYLAGALPLGLRFVWMAWRLREQTDLAMPTFRYSIVYLFALFGFLLADHYLLA